jgi:hypothetical protein
VVVIGYVPYKYYDTIPAQECQGVLQIFWKNFADQHAPKSS